MASTWWIEIKNSMRRLYQTTLNLMQQTTIGNSMLNYASDSLDGVEVTGGGDRVAMSDTIA